MRWLRLLIGVALLSTLGTAVPSYAADPQHPDWAIQKNPQEFVLFGSSKSNKFHRPTCQYVQRIKEGNLVGFRSREEALRMGYVPCKVCRP
ncbi:MAG: hypothetical protein HY597_05495 [Candidatus Omnitrophica bacterium]|nr:hypothetical protein [Candidatus Omnitrophota bacterium]